MEPLTMHATKVESLNTVQSRVTVTVPVETVMAAFTKVALKIQKKAKMNGFRPGKAPLPLIRKAYKESIQYEVSDALIRDTLHEALTQEKMYPIAPPFVDQATMPDEGTAYQFSAVVDLMPTLPIDDSIKHMAVAYTEFKTDEGSVEREVLAMAKRHAKKTPVAETESAQDHHWVTLSRMGSLQGQPLPHWDGKAFSVELGVDEIHPPELTAAIQGMKVGEEKTVDVTLPASFGDGDLAGKTLQFQVQVREIATLQIPTLDDEWAKDLHFTSLEDVREKISRELEAHVKKMTLDSIHEAMMSSISKKFTFEVPPSMVDRMIDQQIDDSRLPDAEKKTAKTNEDLRKSLRPDASRQIRNSLVLHEVSKREKLEVTEEELEKNFQEKFASLVNDHPTEEAKIRKYLESQKEGIRENLLIAKIMDVLLREAVITKSVKVL